MNSKPAIGVSDFKTLITARTSTGDRALYFDKSLMIKHIVDDMSQFFLFTCPRRFGKTLNLDMLRCFFRERLIYCVF